MLILVNEAIKERVKRKKKFVQRGKKFLKSLLILICIFLEAHHGGSHILQEKKVTRYHLMHKVVIWYGKDISVAVLG